MAYDSETSQLDLPWDERRGETPRRGGTAERRVVWSTDKQERKALLESREPSELTKALFPDSSDSGVLRLARQPRVRMPLAWAREPERRSPQRMSIRGFFVGCAIGGVAAAAVLTVLSVAVG